MASFRKTRRKLVYWLLKIVSPAIPMGLLDLATSFCVARWLGSRPYRGMQIMAFPPCKLDAIIELVDALELVRRTDPRRFARIERFIKRIFLANYQTRLGFYRSFGCVCGLKRLPIPESSRALAVYAYAAALVHESTHGLLEKRRFPHTPANRRRLEQLCSDEQARFLARFPGIVKKWATIVGYIDGLEGLRLANLRSRPRTGSLPMRRDDTRP